MKHMAQSLAAGAIVLGLLATPSMALADAAYTVSVDTRQPDVRYFSEFRYDHASVVGGNVARAKELSKKIKRFTMPSVNYYLKPSAKTEKYLKKAKPANFGSLITPTRGCHRNYVCLSQGTSFSTPLIAGSVTDIRARAWSTKTGKVANLRTFVAPGQLPAFTERVKAAIRRDGCYYGFDIDLPPKYSSFPNWVPLDQGIGVWFPEYQFGCAVMTLRVQWP